MIYIKELEAVSACSFAMSYLQNMFNSIFMPARVAVVGRINEGKIPHSCRIKK